ncbi:hypothetical protein OESDEN_21284 [Oesophagostomum dentatum]|uniref:Uncharacterized protein n=1 Tax=Oesophagostomum dentatum TaxID=61180 RepID=A0A0B1S154_OESDE|nr:hypothetical protein OESDEN_21284 [Oesophagostomum dentatum]
MRRRLYVKSCGYLLKEKSNILQNPRHSSSKSKHSPANKYSKGSASSVSPFMEDSSDDDVTSDEEVDPSNPRSYIDLLARAKKKAEKKRQRGNSAQYQLIANEGQLTSIPPDLLSKRLRGFHLPVLRPPWYQAHTWNAIISHRLALTTTTPVFALFTISQVRRVSTVCVYLIASGPATERKYPYTASVKYPYTTSVISSLKRILPVRKPLNFPYIAPRPRLTYNNVHPPRQRTIESPRRMTFRQRPIETPPNLGKFTERIFSSGLCFLLIISIHTGFTRFLCFST